MAKKHSKRRYDLEYVYQGTRKQKRRRALRNAARRKMMRLGRVRKGDGRDVDHRAGLSAGNGLSNLRVQSKRANRSFRRNRRSGVLRRS